MSSLLIIKEQAIATAFLRIKQYGRLIVLLTCDTTKIVCVVGSYLYCLGWGSMLCWSLWGAVNDTNPGKLNCGAVWDV